MILQTGPATCGLFALLLLTQWLTAQNSPVASAQKTPESQMALSMIAAKTDDERSNLLKQRPDLLNAALAGAITDEGWRLWGQVPQAELERIARLAVGIADKIGDKRQKASALRLLGNTQENKAEKLTTFKQGMQLSEEVNDPELTAKFLIGIGAEEESWDTQFDLFKKAIAISEKAGDKKTIAGVWGRIGNHYAQEGDYILAREYHTKSLALKEQLNDQPGISITLSNLGVLNTMQGDLAEAHKNLSRSIEMGERLGAKYGVGVDSYNLGNVYYFMGDYSRAMELYTKSLKLFEELGSGGGIEGASTNIANLYNTQGNYEQARVYLDRASLIYDKTGKEIPQYTLGSYGDSYKVEGRFDKAIEYYEKLLKLKEKSDNKDSLAETLVNIGDCYLLMNNAAEAKKYFDRALKLSESTNTPIWISRSLLGIAESQLMKKDYPAALQSANLAKSQFERIAGSNGIWQLYSTIGRSQAGLGNADAAKQSFRKAVDVVETQRLRVAGGESEQQRFFEGKTSPYYLLGASLLASGSVDEAFRYVEMRKARTLLDALGNGRVRIDRSMTPQESSGEQLLKNAIVSLNTQIEREKAKPRSDSVRLGDLQTQLAKKRLEFDDFRVKLFAAHPELQAQRGEMQPITRAEVAALVHDSRSAVIEFAVSGDQTLLFVISKNTAGSLTLNAFPIDVNEKDLAKKVDGFRTKLAAGDLGFSAGARELYDLLLKPAAGQLAGKTNLVIVPDGSLWDLPFQALQNSQGSYLVETAAVSYAPSLTALREMRKKAAAPRKSERTLLAFGNPVVGRETGQSVKKVFMGEKLEPLPEAERLVNSLEKMYGSSRSKILTGADAREAVAKSESSKYRIVQFAAHGILNNASPMYSYIVLAQKGDDPNEDGLLEAWEMKDLELTADLVILSACDTARGKVSSGEGMIGMTWAMFIAGAPTTVASQWKVESSSTTELMLEFHRQLLAKKKVTKAEALRRAQLKLLKTPKYRHPSYWGAWVLVGDGS